MCDVQRGNGNLPIKAKLGMGRKTKMKKENETPAGKCTRSKCYRQTMALTN